MAIASTIAMAQAQQAIPKAITGAAADSKRVMRGWLASFFCTPLAPGSATFVADPGVARQHRRGVVLA
jgi:hypothetical protein